MRATPTPIVPADDVDGPRHTRWVWWTLLVVGLVTNAYVALSSNVAIWWAKESTSKTSTLPVPVQDVLNARPQTSEADVHVVLWFVAGIAAMFAVRSLRSRAILLGLLVACSGILELAQNLTANRTAQWSDFAGNAFGVVVALLVVVVVSRLREHRSHAKLADSSR